MRICPRNNVYFRVGKSLYAMIPSSKTYTGMARIDGRWAKLGDGWDKAGVDKLLDNNSGWVRCTKPEDVPHARLS